MRKYVLASASPRRKELLATLLPEFEIRASGIEENLTGLTPPHLVMRLSFDKANDIAIKSKDGEVVIGADTVVVLRGKVMGKPQDREDAVRMLKSLSGRTHYVYTGVTVIDTLNRRTLMEYEKTAVTFARMTDAEIKDYVDTKEPMDKAGAYGIQGYAGRFIKKIDGCYFNVVGLPLFRLYHMLKKLGCY